MVNLLLGVLLLALVALTVLVAVRGAVARPGEARAERVRASYAAVRAAVRREVGAFLTVDYRDMDPHVSAVLDGATGRFRRLYDQNQASLRAAAQRARATAGSRVRQIGLGRVEPRRATAYVAADTVVRNRTTTRIRPSPSCPHAGATCRYYRLELQLSKVGRRWKIARLDYVS